ncbi:hypothetical protein DL765_009361 [Monosporascus sp. GIB2]|nr:hypothetical protein DL765_009361 [Monosporascus sp. GIB2]
MTTYIPQLTIPEQVFASAPASILLPVAFGTAVGYSTRPKQTKETYNLIRQPPLLPPPWVFGPVWTVLYGLTGLGLNLAWMPLFFGARRPAAAMLDVLALLGANTYLARLFFGTRDGLADPVAGWCWAPYVAWLGFAAYLNAGVGYLNGWDISDAALRRRKAAGKGAQ